MCNTQRGEHKSEHTQQEHSLLPEDKSPLQQRKTTKVTDKVNIKHPDTNVHMIVYSQNKSKEDTQIKHKAL